MSVPNFIRCSRHLHATESAYWNVLSTRDCGKVNVSIPTGLKGSTKSWPRGPVVDTCGTSLIGTTLLCWNTNGLDASSVKLNLVLPYVNLPSFEIVGEIVLTSIIERSWVRVPAAIDELIARSMLGTRRPSSVKLYRVLRTWFSATRCVIRIEKMVPSPPEGKISVNVLGP